jgi:hypothetical protein
MQRFAMVVTNDPALTRWEVHRYDCPDTRKLAAHGAFVQYLPAESAVALCQRELALYPAQTRDDCKVMPCCDK